MQPDPGHPSRRPVVAAAVALVVALAALTAFVLTRGDDDPEPKAAPSAEPSEVASSTPSAAPSAPPSPSVVATKPVAVGKGRPDCNGPCTVEHRLSRAFLPAHIGQQTLLLAKAAEGKEDQNGNLLHVFLVDDAGRVLWEEHGFGWSYMDVDEKFAVRFDKAGHVFFRVYVADYNFLYVAHFAGDRPRLVGVPGQPASEGFGDGQIVERPGSDSFDVRERVPNCPDGETPDSPCPTIEKLYRWNGTQYVAA